jgi:hypothetical protein
MSSVLVDVETLSSIAIVYTAATLLQNFTSILKKNLNPPVTRRPSSDNFTTKSEESVCTAGLNSRLKKAKIGSHVSSKASIDNFTRKSEETCDPIFV